MIAFTMTLALAPWFANPSIKRWMPTSTPYAAQEIAIVSSAPTGSGLPIGLMPGALPSDHASRQTLKTTAMRLPAGQVQCGHLQSGCFICASADRSALDFLFKHDLFRKPRPTFRDHALVSRFRS